MALGEQLLSIFEPVRWTGKGVPEVAAARRTGVSISDLLGSTGYQGCHFSGIAMTSERILLDRHSGGVPAAAVFADPDKRRTSLDSLYPNGANEPTATIVWSLLRLCYQDTRDFVLWNAFPFHPHRPGELLTNRAPTRSDLEAVAHFLPQMVALMPGARLVAAGRVAQAAIASLGITAPAVRHPAMGGATLFREQLREILSP